MSVINTSSLLENKNLSIFEITEKFICIRFLDQNKERFELEFNLEKGTSFNTFLIISNNDFFISKVVIPMIFKILSEKSC